MAEYTECYMAHLDILGFKHMLKERTCQEILNMYESFGNPLENLHIRINGDPHRQVDMGSDVKMKVMSDSICFYIRTDLPNALYRLLVCCGSFKTKLLEFSPPILVRGAIAVGNLYAEKDITFGPALVDAYLLQEEIAEYPRIIITGKTLDHSISNIKDTELQDLLYSMIFRDEDGLYVVNQIGSTKGWEPKGIHYLALVQHISEVLDSTTDKSVRKKYLYLRKHFLRQYRGVKNV